MMTIPLESNEATFEQAGGKGASLSRLVRLGMPVPAGYLLTTEAYRAYVRSNRLEEAIRESLREANLEDLETLERVSRRIREAFARGKMPEEIREAVVTS